AGQKRNCRRGNEPEETENQCERYIQNFADANEPTGTMLVDREISRAMFVNAQPDQKRCLNRRGVKSEKIERGDSVPQHFQHAGRGSQAGGSKMNRQKCAM